MGINVDKLTQKNSVVLDNGNEIMYDIDYNKKLIVNMEFMGQENNQKSYVNSYGWKRDSRHYFKQLLQDNPKFFCEENKQAIEDGMSPVCDRVFINSFPEYKDFLGDKLIHHHIGEDGQAVALPAGLHTGYGVVHNIEKELGVTENGHRFSNFIEGNYKDGKKFEWKDADEVMEKLIGNGLVNDEHNNQKGVGEKGINTRYREEQVKKATRTQKILKIGGQIGKKLWEGTKIVAPIAGPVIIIGLANKSNKKSKSNGLKKMLKRGGQIGKKLWEGIKIVAPTAGPVIITTVIKGKHSTDSPANNTHASPKIHFVKPHGQHYHTRNGPIWKEKKSFFRGGK